MLTGDLLIGGGSVRGSEGGYRAIDPSNGAQLEPEFAGTGATELARACALAAEAFDAYREAPLESRAVFLEAIAQQIIAIGDPLLERAAQETGLPRARIESERGRTVGQLRLFAEVVRDGAFLDLRIDHAQPGRTPLPRSDLRLRNVPVGPVAVFGASNFPLAFSVAGGDTASALAAGCPVVVKAHPAHPGTSELVGARGAGGRCRVQAARGRVLAAASASATGWARALVADPRIKAVGFTGSRGGGLALQKIANERHEPIPVYAEMSSINPVFVLPHALRARGEAIAPRVRGVAHDGSGTVLHESGPRHRARGRGARRVRIGCGVGSVGVSGRDDADTGYPCRVREWRGATVAASASRGIGARPVAEWSASRARARCSRRMPRAS